MNIKLYIKRAIPIRVLQYTGDNREEILEFTNGGAFFKDQNGIHELIIRTLEGDMMAAPGCYIAQDPIHLDHFYPIQPDVFEKTYIEVGA